MTLRGEGHHKAVFVIDGERFDTLEGFYEEISTTLIPDVHWGRNLNAFNDILRGGFGTPDEGFVVRWVNADRSRRCLGFEETSRQLTLGLKRCHPDNRAQVQVRILQAKRNEGETVFDWLVEIIRDHGDGGEESEDCVELILES